MNDLRETIKPMTSEDYMDRFRAEYWQLKIRYQKLKTMVEMWDKGELDFIPACPRSIYAMQLDAMEMYLDILNSRARLESVEL